MARPGGCRTLHCTCGRTRRLFPLDSADMFAETPPRPVVLAAAGPHPEVPDTEEFLSGLGAARLTSTQVKDPANSPGGDDGQTFEDQEDTADPVAEVQEVETPQRRSGLQTRGGEETEGGGRLRLSENKLSMSETAGGKLVDKSKKSLPPP